MDTIHTLRVNPYLGAPLRRYKDLRRIYFDNDRCRIIYRVNERAKTINIIRVRPRKTAPTGACGIQRSETSCAPLSTPVFGEAVIAILACIAKQERQRISERTRAGMERARKEGKRIGRPQADADRIRQLAAAGQAPGAIAAELGVHRSTVWRALQGISFSVSGSIRSTAEIRAGNRG